MKNNIISQDIQIIIDIYKKLDVKPRKSFDGSKILSDLLKNKSNISKRRKNWLLISARIIGSDYRDNFEKLLDFSYESSLIIYEKILNVSRNEKCNERSSVRGYIYTGIILFLIDIGKDNLVKKEHLKLIKKNGKVIQNAKKMDDIAKILKIINSNKSISNKLIIDDIKFDVKNGEKTETIINGKKVSALRKRFSEKLKKESNETIQSEHSWVCSYPYPDAAHIISVKTCIEEKQFDYILDPNNGVLLDPNTHRLFDKHEIDESEIIAKIKKQNPNFLNKERINFFEQRKIFRQK